MSSPRKQHMVPQLLLKEFANNNRQVFVYDRERDKSYTNNISNIAAERDFYNAPFLNKHHELSEEEVNQYKKIADSENLSLEELNLGVTDFIERKFATDIETRLYTHLEELKSKCD